MCSCVSVGTQTASLPRTSTKLSLFYPYGLVHQASSNTERARQTESIMKKQAWVRLKKRPQRFHFQREDIKVCLDLQNIIKVSLCGSGEAKCQLFVTHGIKAKYFQTVFTYSHTGGERRDHFTFNKPDMWILVSAYDKRATFSGQMIVQLPAFTINKDKMHKSTLEEYIVVEMTYKKGQLERKTATNVHIYTVFL